MHPIERLRFLARSASLPPRILVQEAAGALASFADEPQGFLTACQRVVARQPGSGPLVWLVARALAAIDPYDELWVAADEIQRDETSRVLADAVPEGARVVVVGSLSAGDGELGAGLARRGDLSVLALAAPAADPLAGAGGRLRTAWWEDEPVDDWRRADATVDADRIVAAALGSAVAASALVLVEAAAIGPDGALVPAGGVTAAACGRAHGVPVWLVGGVGRQLGPVMWRGVSAPFARPDPWNAERDQLALTLIDRVVVPTGLVEVPDLARAVTCPECPELFRGLVV